MMRRLQFALILLVLLSVTASAVALRWSWNQLNTPFKSYAHVERIVVIEAGMSGEKILRKLASEGVIPDTRLSHLYLRYVLSDQSLKAGEYRFQGPLTPLEVLDKILAGRVLTRNVTILEGLTLEETAERLAEEGFGTVDAFLAAMRSPSLIADLDAEAETLEGYLFPDTYAFASGTTESALVEALVANARKKIRRVTAGSRRDSERQFSLRRIVTLASIVEKEALIDHERPVIAGVYANRLEKGIGLYADPTVIYALKRLGTWDGNLRRPDLQIDSPYNTYRYSGLPPGPICSPGLASLEAAARPADVPYLYFVSRNDGTHVFAKTLAEHNHNVHLWQKKYWQDRWSRERKVEDSTDSPRPLR
ncbi:MAG: endolytic transglycosylase MltG [Acidobacteriota bacterium]|nr:endolytic transglycosylase MltG [Acidobacteriota bacterium]